MIQDLALTSGRASPAPATVEAVVGRALAEDVGSGDVTTDALFSPEARCRARVLVGEPGLVCGLPIAEAVLRGLDPDVRFRALAADGEVIPGPSAVATIEGTARAVLTGERTALNLLGRLSGVATLTRAYVDAVAGTGALILDTRKTTPGLRAIERYAVRVGGGAEHRFGLDDAVLIKGIHLAVTGGLTEAVGRVRRRIGHLVKVEVEVDTLEQLDEALGLGVDAVLLDNMRIEELCQAVRAARGRTVTEASGGISPETAPAVAATGVDLLSIGWITHSAPALDVGLKLEPPAGRP